MSDIYHNATKDRAIEYFRYWLPRSPETPALDPMEDEYDRMTGGKFCSYHPNANEPFIQRKLKKFLAEESKGFGQRYKDYLKSDKWEFFRRKIIEERGKMCERCGKQSFPLNVHHLTYARIGNELPEDVKVYCLPCHKLMHPGWG